MKRGQHAHSLHVLTSAVSTRGRGGAWATAGPPLRPENGSSSQRSAEADLNGSSCSAEQSSDSARRWKTNKAGETDEWVRSSASKMSTKLELPA